jgi:CTP synthase
MARFIFVTGGVVSSLGKGLLSASLGALLQARGFKVRIRKFDPYLNVDPGHDVALSARRGLCDRRRGRNRPRPWPLRALHRRYGAPVRQCHDGPNLPRHHRPRAARRLSRRDRPGHPARHQCDQGIRADRHRRCSISSSARSAGRSATSKACRSSRRSASSQRSRPRPDGQRPHHARPWIKAAGELKTKPTQHSVRELSSLGVRPDVLLVPDGNGASRNEREKIALFCNVPKSAVIPALDARSIYDVPLQYHSEGLDGEVLKAFRMGDAPEPDLARWHDIMDRLDNYEGEVTIGVVGKYVGLPDAYKSLSEALVHGGLANRVEGHMSAGSMPSCSSMTAPISRPSWSRFTESSFPAASASAGARARSPRSASPASAMSRSSAFAWECRWPASRAPGGGNRKCVEHRVRPYARAGDRPHHRMDEPGRTSGARRRQRPWRHHAAGRL